MSVPRPGWTINRALCLLLGLAACAGFAALGVWQVHRRTWKHALIAQVDARVRAAPVPAPGRTHWPALTRADAEYRRVALRGRYDGARQTLVFASTDLGSGDWVMTPLRRDDGSTVLVNRGFVPEGLCRDANACRPPSGALAVTGLLRMSQPHAFLRRNDPAHGRWYARDVAAIAAWQHLGPVAPYFVDADAAPGATHWPRGGLTVVAFPDNHLVYAITWFALALMALGAVYRVAAPGRRLREGTADP